MYRRKPLAVFATIVLGTGLWLSGCGEVEQPLEIEEEPEVEKPDVEEPDAGEPDVEVPDVEEPDVEVALDFDQEWGELQGPPGGYYAAELLTAGGAYFAVQRDSINSNQLWRAEQGDDWTRIDLPEGEDPANVVEVVGHDDDLYLFAENLLRSQDGGISWELHEWEGVDADELAMARVFDNELYVLAGPNRQGERLYRVDDDVAERIDDGLPDESIVDFAIFQDRLLISRTGHRDGLVVEGDAPGTWESAGVAVDQVFAGVQLHLYDDRAYATAREGIWRSDGDSFEKIVDEPASAAVLAGDRLIFRHVEAEHSTMAIDLSDSMSATPTVEVLAGFDDIYAFKIASNGESLVASALPVGLLHLDLDTDEWQQVTPTLQHISDVVHTPQRSWLLSSQGNLFYSTDDDEWAELSLSGLRISHMLANEDGLSVVTRGGEFMTIFQDGNDWSASEIIVLDSGIPTALLEIGGRLFATFAPKVQANGKGATTTVGGGLYIASTPGVHAHDWTKIGNDLPENSTNTNRPPIYAMHGTDGLMLVIGHNGIYRSTDHGVSWHAVNVDGGFITSTSMSHTAWLIEADGDFFAMTANGERPELLRSQDDGDSWTKVPVSLPQYTRVTDLHAVGSVLMIGTVSQGVLGSTDGGQSWEEVGENFRGGGIRRLRTYEQSLWATTSLGLLELSLDVLD